MRFKKASWAFWIDPTPCASLAGVRIGCAEGTLGQTQPGHQQVSSDVASPRSSYGVSLQGPDQVCPWPHEGESCGRAGDQHSAAGAGIDSSRLGREPRECSCLGIFRSSLENAQINLICPWEWPFFEQGVGGETSSLPSQSRLVWFYKACWFYFYTGSGCRISCHCECSSLRL